MFFKAIAEAQYLYAICYVPDLSKGPELPAKYEDYRDVFSEDKANELLPYSQPEHAIELTDELLYRLIYSLSEKKLKVLCKYIQENLRQGWIKEFTSLVRVPILFILKKDGELQLYINYYRLNKVTIKNQYLLPLIGEIINRLSGTRIYIKLDLYNVYYYIWI